MRVYCYHTESPIDVWFGAVTREELDRQHQQAHSSFPYPVSPEFVATAERLFRELGWEGDIREEHFFAVPLVEMECAVGFVYKQDNNGECFVASPIPLPHLEQR